MRAVIARGALIAIVCLALVGAVSAQGGPYVPAIVDFVAVTNPVTLAEVEAGSANASLSWHIVNVTPGQRVTLDQFVGTGWVSLVPQGEQIEAVDTVDIVIADPLNFGSPTYRLSLLDSRGTALDQRFLVLPYAPDATAPTITEFSTTATSVALDALTDGDARVEVTWAVANRPPQSQIVFEQVQADDALVNVELTRPSLYVPSSGVGAVAPKAPTIAGGAVVVRMSVLAVPSGDVLASQELTVPILGQQTPQVLPPGPSQTTPQVLPPGPDQTTPQVLPTPQVGGPNIVLFTVEPTTVAPGGNVTMTWQVEGAESVQISEVLPASLSGLTYVQLPMSGQVSVPLPAGATSTVTYVLSARNAAGITSTQEVIVTIGG
ncbi:MAG TPA: hypothetical protein VER79_08235 [Candidatus Limnocylindrales bacterium]|nr:hypothetical protein [Candidatus Limnocylindrales bacterium]